MPDLVFLLETLINNNNIHRILPQMGFEHYDFSPPINHSRGIVILWNSGIHASVLLKEQQVIHMLVHDTKNVKNLIILGIYAPAPNRDKNHSYEHLANAHHYRHTMVSNRRFQ